MRPIAVWLSHSRILKHCSISTGGRHWSLMSMRTWRHQHISRIGKSAIDVQRWNAIVAVFLARLHWLIYLFWTPQTAKNRLIKAVLEGISAGFYRRIWVRQSYSLSSTGTSSLAQRNRISIVETLTVEADRELWTYWWPKQAFALSSSQRTIESRIAAWNPVTSIRSVSQVRFESSSSVFMWAW